MLRQNYAKFLIDFYVLPKDPTQQKIFQSARKLKHQHDMSFKESIRQSIKLRKDLFEVLWPSHDINISNDENHENNEEENALTCFKNAVMESEELDSDLFANWVRGSKGLEYLQEGLQEFVGEKVLQCRDNTLKKVILTLPSGSPHNSATNVRKIIFLQIIFNSTKACSRRTCYQNRPPTVLEADQLDEGNALMAYVARDTRNKILHSSKLEIDETTVCSYLDAFIVVLQDPKCLINDEASKKAVDKLTQLKNNKIHISQGDKVSLLQMRNKALTELDDKIAEHLRKLDEKALALRYKLKLDVDEFKDSALADVENAGISVKQSLTVEKGVAISDIATARKEGIHDIAGKTTDGISEIKAVGGQALQEISEAKNDIDGQKSEAISEICNLKKDVLSVITKAGTEAKENFLVGASAARSDMSGKVVLRESIFQKVRRKLKNAFSPSSSKSHFKVLPSQSKKDLKNELITWYNTNKSTVCLSPLTDAFPTPLAGFYIMPEIDIQTYLPGGRKETTRVKSLQDLFTWGKKVPQEIYLSAVAGFGKTAFSKYLALTWCQAHQKGENYKHFKEEELKALSSFEFLFMVELRDSAKVCDVDDMIEQQVIQYLPCSSSMPKGLLKDILHDEKCLVILDGLDEWTHPDNNCTRLPKSIPHRYAREKCVILTTTRPWKLGMSNLNQIGETVELVKLNEDNIRKFNCNAMKMLNVNLQDGELQNEVCRFEEAISDHDLEDMESTPLLLLYLICLWVEKIPIGNSAVELYTGIIQLLLSRTEKLHGKFHSSCEKSLSYIPDCFRKHQHFCSYYTFLLTIGELAFNTLFSKKKEHTLVFDEHVAEKYLNQEDLKLSCLSGILSEINYQQPVNYKHLSVVF
ncbi:uncharacterized protein LOC132723517 [Ruditapes philippinarum]|uniref:uncharacterized protein LOC132723517 n=1 Tax=Ruditapes philippinarum TaxID=129788 RepID=UPI00295AA909|nr:uncharacterized protein LOC132723517 [Ruditapes philippinarum]